MDEAKHRYNDLKKLRYSLAGIAICYLAAYMLIALFLISIGAGANPAVDSLVYPENASTIAETTTYLLVEVSDVDGDFLTVEFKKADHTLIGTATVSGSGEVGCVYSGLAHGNTYDWYCNVTDGGTTTTSEDYTFDCDSATASSIETDQYIDVDGGWTDIWNTTAMMELLVLPFINTMGSWFYGIFVLFTVGLVYLKTQKIFLPSAMLLIFGVVMRSLLPVVVYPFAYGMIALGFTGIVYIIFSRKL